MPWPKGRKRSDMRWIECNGGCGTKLWRHVKTAKCETCQRRRQTVSRSRMNARDRVHGRRYRLLIAALGWLDEDFDVNLALLKKRLQQKGRTP